MRRAVLVALVGLLAWAGAASAAETVAIRAAPHPGYGRIVFDWPKPARHEASIDGRTLTIRFARPLEAKLPRIAALLPDYVSAVSLSPDGRTVRATLKGDYRLRVLDDKSAAVFDLLAAAPSKAAQAKPDRKAAAPAKAAAAPATPAAAPKLAVRTGTHEGFGRLVFDWRAPVGMKLDQSGDTVFVRFDRPARIDLARLRAALPAPISAVAEGPGPDLAVAFRVPDGARLRHFTSGTAVVLDVLAPAKSEAAAPMRPARAKPATPPSPPAAAAAAKPVPVPVPTPAAAPTLLPPTRLFPAASSPAAERRTISRAADGPQGAGLVSVDVTRGVDRAALRFNWRRPVAAAVFRRRGEVWVTFNAAARIDVASLAVLGKPVVRSVAQVPIVGGTAIRFALDPTFGLDVHTEGTIWVVEARIAPSRADKPIPVLPQGSVVAGDARIVMPVPDPGPVLRLRDPEVGDELRVVPLAEAGRGVAAPHRFVDVEVLGSAQGVAVHPLADGVAVASTPTGVTVSRPGGLRLSSVADRVRARSQPPPPIKRLLDLAAWQKGPGPTPAESREKLTRAAAEAVPARRTEARLRLARYFLAQGFGPEALGVLAQVAREAPDQIERPAFRAMRGAAYFLAGEYGPAAEDLAVPSLANNVEAAPWRGAIAAMRGDWRTAQREFGDIETVMSSYPPWLAARFGLLAAESSLAVGDTGTAQARLDVLADRSLSPGDRDMLDVLQGFYEKDSGNIDAALKLWRQVASHGDRRASARARFALADTLLGQKAITLDQAIDRLERLRFAWRGDVFEFDLLRRLAHLYAQRDDSRDALETLKEAATYFHDIGGVQAVAKDMAGMFRHLFADGGVDKLPPVTALALFDEFRELTPPGPEGDAMVRKLAERLVSVDLLGEAARLYGQQVKFRLKGVEKARVGARLAEVRLLDNKPKDALAALAESDQPNLPDDVVETRRLDKARAEAALGQRPEALATLAGDSSLAAEELRASMAWHAKDWAGAAAAFAELMERKDLPPAPDDRARLVLSRAVALALAGDEQGLAAIRDAEGEAMKKTKYGAAFAAVVGPPSPDSIQQAIKLTGDIGAVEAMLGEVRGAKEARPPAEKTAIN